MYMSSDKKISLPEASDESPLKILVVEDNLGDFVIIRELLKASGQVFELVNASSLKQAIVLLDESKYNGILLDLGLPDSSGLDTLRAFLQFRINSPVVVMTGLDDEDIALEALRVGAQDYIVKNKLDSDNLLRSVKYSIERKNLENLQRKNSHQLSILSETTAALYEGDDIPSIYTLLCNSIRQLTGNALVASIELDSSLTFSLSNAEQIQTLSEKIFDLTGIDILNQVFSLSDQKLEIINLFKDGRIHLVTGGIYDLLGGKMDFRNAEEIEKMLGLGYTYVIGFPRNENFYGGILIFSKEKIEDGDCRIMENLCSQASLSIYRRIIKRNLVLSEARYQKLAEDLEEIVRERTMELEIANRQLRRSEALLKELNATKDKFFNIVAHDLKNPFTSLLGATELLSHNIQNMDKEKIRRLAQILNDSAKSGYSILLNLLDWSRSQTGMIKINLQRINLKTLLDENLSDMHLNSLDKQITLRSEVNQDIHIFADKNMLNTILRNLLSNALKFTPRGGEVNVSAMIVSDEIKVSVADNGIGIPAENIDKLFRIDSKYSRPGTEKELGTGLGLKLCKEFIDKLGGKIWVESVENKGSQFIFSIPLIREESLVQP
jgi:signal transduction histidine kinase/DNA-binding response OmpR family regulator